MREKYKVIEIYERDYGCEERTEVFLVDGKLKPGNVGAQVFGC